MIGLGLLVHARYLTGSFAAAGIVTGSFAVSVGVGGPLLGRLVDRRGQTLALLVAAGVGAVLLIMVARLPAHTATLVLVALAVPIGLATPPVGACMRTLLPGLLDDAGALRAAYALESSALELTFICGPPLALGLSTLWSTGVALATAGVVQLIATIAFAAQPASRVWRPTTDRPRPRGGSLQAPAMRTLVIVLLAVGGVFGAVEVGVTAAARTLDSTVVAGPLLAVWGVGSLAGGVVAARLGGGARTIGGLTLLLVALTAGHLALAATTGRLVAMALVLFLAGAAIAPTYATVYAMVDKVAPPGTVTEAFTWLATAVAAGEAAGAAGAGVSVDVAGAAATFALAGAAGAVAILVTITRARSFASLAAPQPSDASDSGRRCDPRGGRRREAMRRCA